MSTGAHWHYQHEQQGICTIGARILEIVAAGYIPHGLHASAAVPYS